MGDTVVGMAMVEMASGGCIMTLMGGQVAMEAGLTQGMREVSGKKLNKIFQERGPSVPQQW